MADRLPSLGTVSSRVRSEREFQLRHFDSLDAKAGIILGFSGVLVALASGQRAVTGEVGMAFGAVAAVLSVLAFVPRKYPVLNTGRLRHYLRAEEKFTQLQILDSELQMIDEAADLARTKAFLLKAALGTLVLAVVLLVTDAVIA